MQTTRCLTAQKVIRILKVSGSLAGLPWPSTPKTEPNFTEQGNVSPRAASPRESLQIVSWTCHSFHLGVNSNANVWPA